MLPYKINQDRCPPHSRAVYMCCDLKSRIRSKCLIHIPIILQTEQHIMHNSRLKSILLNIV